MLFRELKQGYPLYILNRGTMEIQTGAVTEVTKPHITKDPQKLAQGSLITVIDVSVNLGGKVQNIELTDSLAYTNSSDGSLLISPNKEDILNGVRMMKAQCEESLKLVGQHKEVIKKCDTILADFDPIYKQNQDNEARFTAMQQTITEQAASISELKDMMSQLIQQLK